MTDVLLVVALLLVLAAAIIMKARLGKVRRARAEARAALQNYQTKFEAYSESRAIISQANVDLQQASSFSELARAFMVHAIPTLGAQYGLLYLLDEDTQRLSAIGGYAQTGGIDASRSFGLGDGLVGLCAAEQQAVTIYSLPDTPLRITSGIGKAKPKQLAMQALVLKGRVVGVLEFAALANFNAGAKPFLEEMMPTLAMTIDILDHSLRTKTLLETKLAQTCILEQQQIELQASSAARDAANAALQSRLEELAGNRRAMLNIMEDAQQRLDELANNRYAMLNILEDLEEAKAQAEAATQAATQAGVSAKVGAGGTAVDAGETAGPRLANEKSANHDE